MEQEEVPDSQHWVPAGEGGKKSQEPLHDEMEGCYTQFLLEREGKTGQ